MKKRRISYGFLVGCLFLGFWISENATFLLLFVTLLVVPMAELFLQRRSIDGLQIEIESAEESIRLGEILPIWLKMQRKHGGTIGDIRIRYELQNRLFLTKQEGYFSVSMEKEPAKEEKKILFHRQCGAVDIALCEAEVIDSFGLFRKTIPLSSSCRALVVPELPATNVHEYRQPETVSGGETLEEYRKGTEQSIISDLREYRPGDSLRSIHWKLSGKQGELIVRQSGHLQEYHSDLMLFCDLYRAETVDCINGVLAIANAVSHELSMAGRAYYVSHISGSGLKKYYVREQSHQKEALMKMVRNARLHNKHDLQLLYRDLEKGDISKILYITTKCESEVLQRLSEKAEVTVLLISENAEMSVRDVRIIPIHAGKYRSSKQWITI